MKTTFMFWSQAAFFLVVLFGNNLLANLSVESRIYVENWRELNNTDVRAFVFGVSFAFQKIIKRSNLNCQFEEFSLRGLLHPQQIQRIVEENAVLILDSERVSLAKVLNPSLGLYKGKNDEFFGIGGYLFNPSLSPKLVKKINQKYVKNICFSFIKK